MAIDLGSGLLLEDRGTRLAWYSTSDDVRRLTRPDLVVVTEGQPRKLTFAWNDHVFGGLPCQVTATFEPGRETLIGVRLVFRYAEAIRSMSSGFAWLEERLRRSFGPPQSIQDDGERGEARRAIGGVSLRHEYFVGMGGGHYLFIFPDRLGVAESENVESTGRRSVDRPGPCS